MLAWIKNILSVKKFWTSDRFVTMADRSGVLTEARILNGKKYIVKPRFIRGRTCSWSSDGKELIVAHGDNELEAVSVLTGTKRKLKSRELSRFSISSQGNWSFKNKMEQ